MKHQGNWVSGLILIIFGCVGLVMGVSCVLIFHFMVGVYEKTPMVFGMLFWFAAAALVPIIIGITLLVRGKQSAKIMRTGKQSSCVIHNILRVKNGYEMVVSYRGESGTEYKHGLYISLRDAELFKPGMRIECFIKGEDCYVDPTRIVEVKDDEF